MENEEELEISPLFKGLTLPPMKWGVTYNFLYAEGMSIVLLFIWTSNLLVPFLLIPIHTVAVLISADNPRIFVHLGLWMKTVGKNLNRGYWGGSSYEPMPYVIESLDELSGK